MDRQKIYETVRSHLLKQGEKSVDCNGHCAYRGENNLKCAIGILIPDSIYNKEMEAKTANELLSCFSEMDSVFGIECESDGYFLNELQHIHDQADPDDWEDEFDNFAEHKCLINLA